MVAIAVVIGTSSPGTPVLDRRAEGMLTEFTTRLPGVRVLGPFDTKQDTSANLSAWQLLVSMNPAALAFVGTGDADGWNLASIREDTGGHWLAGAFDLDSRSLAGVQNGDLVLVSPEHFAAGAVAGRLQARLAEHGGRLPHGWVKIPGLVVNQQNVDEVVHRQESTTARQQWFAPQVDTILAGLPGNLAPLKDAG